MAIQKDTKQSKLFPALQTEGKLKDPKTDYSFGLTDALSAPILTFSHNWASCIPERLIKLVPLARLINLRKGINQATWVEGTIYIYTRTLESPMDRDWVDIYTHISCKTLETWFKEEAWEYVKAPRSLSDWLQKQLDDLLGHIYTKRREILKQRIKESETTINNDSAAKSSKRVRTQPTVQQTSFNF